MFYGRLRELAHPVLFADLISSLRNRDWVVYAKPPFGTPDQILRYLARYTHRVAISNGRLVNIHNGRVSFKWRDSRDGNQIKETSIDAVEFIRRFLLHVLPSGFVKIRHFGFLSNRNRKAMIDLCRGLLPPLGAVNIAVVVPRERICPNCNAGQMHVVDWRHSPPCWCTSPETQATAYCNTS
jgi:hypothetical protein